MRIDDIDLETFHVEHGPPQDVSDDIYHWTPPGDMAILKALVDRHKPWTLLEIGTAKGHMTANLARWAGPAARVFTIGILRNTVPDGSKQDNPATPEPEELGMNFDAFGQRDRIISIIGDSLDPATWGKIPHALDFTFIDADHDEEHVLADTEKVYERTIEGGIIAWHDANKSYEGVDAALAKMPYPETAKRIRRSLIAYLMKSSGS